MWRLVGASMLIAACGLLGVAIGLWYIQRARHLRDVIVALQVLETELAYSVHDLPAALRLAGAAVKSPVADLFEAAARTLDERPGCSGPQAWLAALQHCGAHLALLDDDRAALQQVGVRLGASDADDQVRYLRAAQHRLRRRAED